MSRAFELANRMAKQDACVKLFAEHRRTQMSDVRRVMMFDCSDMTANYDCIMDDPNGTHALMPWEEYERLRKVVDVARNASQQCGIWADKLAIALRELEESERKRRTE